MVPATGRKDRSRFSLLLRYRIPLRPTGFSFGADIDVYNIAQFTLCKIGDTDGGYVAFDENPFVFFGSAGFRENFI